MTTYNFVGDVISGHMAKECIGNYFNQDLESKIVSTVALILIGLINKNLESDIRGERRKIRETKQPDTSSYLSETLRPNVVSCFYKSSDRKFSI